MNSLEEIFANTRVDPVTGCRIWLRGLFPEGYGQVWWQGRSCLVHRVVWTLIYGDPGALDVLHTCDNEPCCEPTHLFLGTQMDNVEDSMAKGRRPQRMAKGRRPQRKQESGVEKLRKNLAKLPKVVQHKRRPREEVPEGGSIKTGYHTPELDTIFWARVRKKDLDECWPYIGKSRAANPKVRQTFQGVVASRYAYEAAFGPIPEGARVCHTCPGGNCCNPGHLVTSNYPDSY